MTRSEPIYVEAGAKRVFAGAMEWPGWCRSGRDEDAAVAALLAYRPRYAAAVGPAGPGSALTKSGAMNLEVIERLEGTATTDFGAPGVAPAADAGPLDPDTFERLSGLLRACWATFDAVAEANVRVPLRKGPRGGGRDVTAMVSHVLDAERAYLHKVGGSDGAPKAADGADAMAGVRDAMIEALAARARGEPFEMGRRTAPLWVPRYCIRRSAWHALDHAWEIEDRAGQA